MTPALAQMLPGAVQAARGQAQAAAAGQVAQAPRLEHGPGPECPQLPGQEPGRCHQAPGAAGQDLIQLIGPHLQAIHLAIQILRPGGALVDQFMQLVDLPVQCLRPLRALLQLLLQAEHVLVQGGHLPVQRQGPFLIGRQLPSQVEAPVRALLELAFALCQFGAHVGQVVLKFQQPAAQIGLGHRRQVGDGWGGRGRVMARSGRKQRLVIGSHGRDLPYRFGRQPLADGRQCCRLIAQGQQAPGNGSGIGGHQQAVNTFFDAFQVTANGRCQDRDGKAAQLTEQVAEGFGDRRRQQGQVRLQPGQMCGQLIALVIGNDMDATAAVQVFAGAAGAEQDQFDAVTGSARLPFKFPEQGGQQVHALAAGDPAGDQHTQPVAAPVSWHRWRGVGLHGRIGGLARFRPGPDAVRDQVPVQAGQLRCQPLPVGHHLAGRCDHRSSGCGQGGEGLLAQRPPVIGRVRPEQFRRTGAQGPIQVVAVEIPVRVAEIAVQLRP